jgi:hypothetical protein
MFNRATAAVLAAALCGVAFTTPAPRHLPLTIQEQRAVLSELNRARASVAWSARRPPLDWDEGLAGTAQAWADACVADPSGSGLIAHNPNRGAGHAGTVGENIAGWSVPPSPNAADRAAALMTLVTLWTDEGAKYDYAANTCDGEPYSIHSHWKTCGHYTQIVAASTTRVGCGRSDCVNLRHRSTLVCDFSAAGNTVDADTGVLARP